ncbi:RNA polymerase sigma-70 factor, ECF subfamily [Polaromonas sp. OV174]|uniref:RNA polymerase sigma factor n=1 Tax=Polaromonas sp. OV174 TaxID=1855300 RepID=UPI0008E26777|nr:RNA polymerase sigma factor [Polaromonas sp. OV174]SFB86797.1 RNA polymerase sigma-70 factor, ECF subfamily [Polaromonas sp. OV174]
MQTLSPAAPAPSDPQVLMAQLAAGNLQAFEQLMRTHNRRLFRVARSILHADGDAEDAVQEAYLRAFVALKNFQGTAQLSTWLTRIVINEALNKKRQQSRAGQRLQGDTAFAMDHNHALNAIELMLSETPEDLAMREQLRSLLESKIDRLPDEHRTVFMLRAVEELSVEETAQCLDISPALVKTRLFRARQMLRQSLQRDVKLGLQDAFAFEGGRCDRMVNTVLQAIRHGSGVGSTPPP